jgi:hypothetical protein
VDHPSFAMALIGRERADAFMNYGAMQKFERDKIWASC